jgi:hypothetical protein
VSSIRLNRLLAVLLRVISTVVVVVDLRCFVDRSVDRGVCVCVQEDVWIEDV